MLEKLEIRGFQVHHRYSIEFDPRITTIVGPSDAGKSALLRALRWVMMNTPGGNFFITHGQTLARARLTVDGYRVVRTRGDTRNEYRLGKKRFVAFGTGVPEPISNLFNVSQLNFQLQQELPFWFSETAGTVSRQLNAIVDLGIIDESLGRSTRVMRRAKNEIEFSEIRLQKALNAREGLRWVQEAEQDLIRLEVMERELQESSDRLSVLSDLAFKVREQGEQGERRARAAKEGCLVVGKGKALQRVQKRFNKLSSLIDMLRRGRRLRQRPTAVLREFQKRGKAWKGKCERKRALASLLLQAGRRGEEAQNARARATRARNTLRKKMKGRCPLCGSLVPSP